MSLTTSALWFATALLAALGIGFSLSLSIVAFDDYRIVKAVGAAKNVAPETVIARALVWAESFRLITQVLILLVGLVGVFDPGVRLAEPGHYRVAALLIGVVVVMLADSVRSLRTRSWVANHAVTNGRGPAGS